jgi:NADPH2:quinone reductase
MVVKGKVTAGETVLVNGAGGGVGTAAVRVAQYCGARVVASVGSVVKATRLRAMGVEHIVDYRAEDLAAGVMRLTGGRGVDLALETVGGDILRSTIDCMAAGGRIAIGGAHAGETVAIDIVKLFRRQIQILTTHSYPQSTTAKVFDLMSRGNLAPLVAATYALSEAGQAQQLLSGRNSIGKVVMTVNADAW